MSKWLAPIRWIFAWLDRAFCALLALFMAQIPAFTHQYVDQLATARSRTESTYVSTTQAAQRLNMPPATYLDQTEKRQPELRDSLNLVRNILERHERYDATYTYLQDAKPWLRPLYLMSRLDPNVRASVSFQPAWPTKAAGWIYASIGLTLGWLITSLIGWMFMRRKKRKGVSGPLPAESEVL